jgi:hypothetical protein
MKLSITAQALQAKLAQAGMVVGTTSLWPAELAVGFRD